MPDKKDSQNQESPQNAAETLEQPVTVNKSEKSEILIVEEIKNISSSIISQAELLRGQINNSEVQRGLAELRQSTQVFQALAETAIMGNLSPAGNPKSTILQQYSLPLASPSISSQYGCGGEKMRHGCGPEHKPSCCIQLYISRVRAIEGQRGADKNQLELIIAVQALESWGLVPGLSGNLGVNVKAGWVSVYGPIGKFCVPCNECITIPLFADAMEVETNAAGGRPEFGSNSSAMTLRCDCQVAPVHIVVDMAGGGVGGGIVEIEVSAKTISGGCC
jgi:hypothetical protein